MPGGAPGRGQNMFTRQINTKYWETWMKVIELPIEAGVSSNYDICKSRRTLGYCARIPIARGLDHKPVDCTNCKCCNVI